MKLVKIKNNSSEPVQIEHKNGASTSLPPGTTLKDVDVINLAEVKGRVDSVIDLTEVTEHRGKTVLHG